jgi:hypothetical protein
MVARTTDRRTTWSTRQPRSSTKHMVTRWIHTEGVDCGPGTPGWVTA